MDGGHVEKKLSTGSGSKASDSTRHEKPKLLETRIFELKVRELQETVDKFRGRKKRAIERLGNTTRQLEEKDAQIALIEGNAKAMEEKLAAKRLAAKACKEKMERIRSEFNSVIAEVKAFGFATMHGDRAVTRKLVIQDLAAERGFTTASPRKSPKK
jgi:chromosome segregation ATPase